jgi:hypothetical protein
MVGAVWIYDNTPAIMEAGKTAPAFLQNICRELTGRSSINLRDYMMAASVAVGMRISVMSLVLPHKDRFVFRR